MSKQYNIAFVVSAFPILSQTFVSLQLAELLRQGHKVTIFNLGEIGNKSDLPEGCEIILKKANIFNLKKTKLNLLKTLKVFTGNISGTYHLLSTYRHGSGRLASLAEVVFLDEIAKFEVVNFQFTTIASDTLYYKKIGFFKKQKCFVSGIRGYDITRNDLHPKVDWDLLFEHCKVFMPVCESLQNKLKKLNPNAASMIVHSPININAIESLQILNNTTLNKEITFISVGRLVEKKGIKIAIRALHKFKYIHPEIQFNYLIVGAGPEATELKRLSSELQLERCISFLGAKSSSETIKLMSQSDALLVPSIEAQNGDSEGIPNVIKEGILCKLQIIASNHSGIPELVTKNTGYLADENNDESFFYAIQEMYNNHKNWESINKTATEVVKNNYCLSKTTAQLLKVYEKYSLPHRKAGGA